MGFLTCENVKVETAILANGCFWCTEAVFQRLRGVKSVIPGYSGGHVDSPTYGEVSSGDTGHAEAIKIEFAPDEISYREILEVFFATHDPTTLNRQGNDIGPQYRSAIFYNSPEQKSIAEEVKSGLGKSGEYESPIVTEITEFTGFYEAEDYHKNYYENHKDAPYCQVVIRPKLEKLEHLFGNKLK